jgi:hypothetical protein
MSKREAFAILIAVLVDLPILWLFLHGYLVVTP